MSLYYKRCDYYDDNVPVCVCVRVYCAIIETRTRWMSGVVEYARRTHEQHAKEPSYPFLDLLLGG